MPDTNQAAEETREPKPAAAIPLADLKTQTEPVREIGGRKNGLDPTRYGDWEKDGRCIDF